MFRYVYILVFGLLIAITTSVTAKYFYSIPKEPEYPQFSYGEMLEDVSETVPSKNKRKSKILPSLSVRENDTEIQSSSYAEYGKRLDEYRERMAEYEAAVDRGDKDSVTVIIAVTLFMIIIAGVLYGKVQFFPESIISAAFFLFLSISAFDFSYYGNSGDVINRPIIQVIIFYIGSLITGIIGYELFVKKPSPQMPQ